MNKTPQRGVSTICIDNIFMLFSLASIINEFRQSMRLSIPLIMSQLIYGASGFFITMMVAHLGKDELATNALVWMAFITCILFFLGILMSIGIMIAQSHGANDTAGIRTSFNQGIYLAIFFSIPMMALMWVLPYILHLTHQNPEIIALATPYFHSLVWCMLPINLIVVVEQLLAGIELTRLLLIMSIVQVPMELGFDYALIFGKFGMPKLGLVGIGYGIAIALSILFTISIIYMKFSKKFHKYNLFAKMPKINKKYLLEITRVGLPLGIMYCIEVAIVTILAYMMGNFGNDALAAHQIAHQCFIFALAVIFGISQGTTVRVGHEVGRNNKDALKLTTLVNIGIGFCFMLFMAGFYISFPKVLIGLDVDIHDPKYLTIVNYATSFLFIAAILQLIDSIRNITMGALRGLKDTTWPMTISFIAFWLIVLPAAYFMAFKTNLAGKGIWWGFVVGISIGMIMLLIRFFKIVKTVDLKQLVTKS